MLQLSDLQGAIFDVDDTLLDNQARPGNLTASLHSRSRLAAVHEVGKIHGIPALLAITPEQNAQAFVDSPIHTLEGGVWQILIKAGLVTGEMDPNNKLLQEIAALKDESHGEILKAEGKAFPGAVEFVRGLAQAGLEKHLAIASTALRRDIDIFLDKTGLTDLFPEDHIISRGKFTHPKPNPEAFNLAFASLRLLETARSHVLALEDDSRGIASAKAAGLFTCAIATRLTKSELLALPTPPDIAVDNYAELSELFDPTVAKA